jgi:hypothetical protein
MKKPKKRQSNQSTAQKEWEAGHYVRLSYCLHVVLFGYLCPPK